MTSRFYFNRINNIFSDFNDVKRSLSLSYKQKFLDTNNNDETKKKYKNIPCDIYIILYINLYKYYFFSFYFSTFVYNRTNWARSSI